jgi:hypothetical protein
MIRRAASRIPRSRISHAQGGVAQNRKQRPDVVLSTHVDSSHNPKPLMTVHRAVHRAEITLGKGTARSSRRCVELRAIDDREKERERGRSLGGNTTRTSRGHGGCRTHVRARARARNFRGTTTGARGPGRGGAGARCERVARPKLFGATGCESARAMRSAEVVDPLSRPGSGGTGDLDTNRGPPIPTPNAKKPTRVHIRNFHSLAAAARNAANDGPLMDPEGSIGRLGSLRTGSAGSSAQSVIARCYDRARRAL